LGTEAPQWNAENFKIYREAHEGMVGGNGTIMGGTEFGGNGGQQIKKKGNERGKKGPQH